MEFGTREGLYALAYFLAGPGYDRASGLGSADVANLIKNWSAAVFRPTVTTLSVSPAILYMARRRGSRRR